MSDEDLILRLVALKGIGRWTVEMFLIYILERMDVLPADDFGVREGHRRLKSLPKALSAKEIAREGQRWSPYRTIAALYLWRVPRWFYVRLSCFCDVTSLLLIPTADAFARDHQHSP
jgi:DNA-3-methyladenine glycosylase II